jgi:uroporphyrinogen decarboxylase
MTSRERLVAALDRRVPDRLPVTTHHLMLSFLQAIGGMTERQFFDRFGLDAICWTTPLMQPRADAGVGPNTTEAVGGGGPVGSPTETGPLGGAGWRLESERVPDNRYVTTRYRFCTRRGSLTTVLQDDGCTTWVRERVIKEKRDVAIVEEIVLNPCCDVAAVNAAADAMGERGIVRGAVPGFPVYGQPGCWQDAAVLAGIEPLILATFSDPGWVRDLLSIVQRPKLAFLETVRGARFDLIELGGGDASSTVISPSIFDRFVAPFDAPLVAAAHAAGVRVVYHTCGGMMPFLERIADMGPDAMETFTPKSMGGDARLDEAKRRVGGRVCMIGGFDQFHHLVGCDPADTRAAVRRLFAEAGGGGGFILAPSDHFFEADAALLEAFADQARACRYS